MAAATTRLAQWSYSLSSSPSSKIPPSVLHAALRSFYNYAGCAIAGFPHPATAIAVKSLSPFFAANRTSSLLGSGGHRHRLSADAPNASLINGLASHVHDYDDTHLSTIIHPTGPVASALLAYAQFCSSSSSSSAHATPISGLDFLTALIAGIEVECLLGLAVWPSHYDVGWHITATVGSIGAAVAVGKVMRLNMDQLSNAIGIASVQVTGMREHFGSHSKALGVGKAAKAGLEAAVMAQVGMTAAEGAIDGKRGWVACVCPDKDTGLRRLGDMISLLEAGEGLERDGKWEIEKNAFKPFPCGIVIHPIIDGCVQLHKAGLDVGKIRRVKIRVHPLVLELTGKKTPRDGLEGKFSVYHGAAVGLLLGKAGPTEYEDNVVTSQDTLRVREKIEAVVDQGLRADECWIEVETTDQGEKLEKHIEHAVGSLKVPLTDGMLTDKFLGQVTPVVGREEASKASEVLWSLQSATDVAALVDRVP